MSNLTSNNVVANSGETSDSIRARFRARYQCYSNNPDMLRALVAHELPDKTDMAVRLHVWNCDRCRGEYLKLEAESVAEAAASPELNRSANEPVEETIQSNIGMEPQTAGEEYADFCKLLKDVISGQQSKEALLLNPVFQTRLPRICLTVVRDVADVDELTNYVRLVVCEKLDQFRPNYRRPYGNFFKWVSLIARNKAVDDLRRRFVRQGDRQLEEEYAVQGARGDIEANAERYETVERFRAFVGKLEPVTQKVMHYYVEDNSAREIGEKLAREGIKISHVTIGKLVRKVMADFIASENARRAGTIARKGKYLSRGRRRERGDSPARKTGS